MMNRGECERNVCEKELRRVRYGLEKLVGNKDYDHGEIRKRSSIDGYWSGRDDDEFTDQQDYDSTVRSSSLSDSFASPFSPSDIDRTNDEPRENFSELQSTTTIFNPTHKSLLYQILEAKLLDCRRMNQRVNKTSSDSTSIRSSTDNRSPSSYLITPQASTTKTISSLESSSTSSFPSQIPSLHINSPVAKSTTKKETLGVNDYKKSTLTVPTSKRSGSKKSKKKKTKRKSSNKKSRSTKRKAK